ncbi:Kinetochore protein Mis14-like protein [Elsinoe fawcettii]|nr:Kinetochore protein Mis14-like protein [Elsinoe fawcettii]
MDTTHRKIELQAPADLQFLISTASLLARQKIELHFPPSATASPTTPGQEDPMRRLVEAEVQSFLSRTFAGVKSNISINGLDGADMEKMIGEKGEVEETEAFDAKLARRIQAVSGEIEDLTLELANLRREAPGKMAGMWEGRQEEERRWWEEKMRRGEEKRDGERGEIEVKVEGLEDVGDMRRSWEEGTRRLVEVKEGIGAVVGRGERAREGVRYLETA